MSGVSNLGKALTVIFTFSLLALLSELLYVLWRRRILFRRHRDEPQTAVDHQPNNILLTSNISSQTSKKDLLYFLCLRTQSRVEPDGSAPTRRAEGSSPEDDQVEIIDLYKLREMFGPSRVLFTIREEEKEDLESEKSITKSRNLSQSFDDTGASPEFVVVIEEIEETPFSTPCDSPLFFTPLASPVHEIITRACVDETCQQ